MFTLINTDSWLSAAHTYLHPASCSAPESHFLLSVSLVTPVLMSDFPERCWPKKTKKKNGIAALTGTVQACVNYHTLPSWLPPVNVCTTNQGSQTVTITAQLLWRLFTVHAAQTVKLHNTHITASKFQMLSSNQRAFNHYTTFLAVCIYKIDYFLTDWLL